LRSSHIPRYRKNALPRKALTHLAATLALTLILEPGTVAASEPALPDNSTLDSLHQEWSRRVLETASAIDNFFFSARVDEEGREEEQKTRIRAYLKFGYDDNEGISLGGGLKGKLYLPRTQNRLHIMFGGDDEKTATGTLDQSQDISIRVRPKLLEAPRHHLRVDIGLRKRIGKYQPYGRVRHRQQLDSRGPWLPSVANKLYYFSRSKIEYHGQLNLDRCLSPNLFFRSASLIRWYENNPDKCSGGFCLDQYFTLYERLLHSSHEALAYDAEFFFRNKPEFELYDAVIKARYRRMSHLDWLFWEITPAVHFPAKYKHDPAFALMFRLDGIFGYNETTDVIKKLPSCQG
tara:strand:+ start:213 stop:1256 length:1044 start_codon:yes stop_codon:yes gene_type:complete